MSPELLTRDNNHLPEVKSAEDEICENHRVSHFNAIACNQRLPSSHLLSLIHASVSENTRKAYQSDLAHFKAWGGAFPSSPIEVATYLAEHTDKLSVASLVRRVATMSKVHEAHGVANPCRTEMVRATLRGIKRIKGTAQQQAKPLLREDLMLVVDRLGTTGRDARDRALLLIGFAGGFRRSELVGLDHADIEHVRQGMIVTLRRSKTDQEGAGRKVGIPHGRTRYCPVAALEAWALASGTNTGPVFRPVDRHSNVHPDRLSSEAVSIVVRERVAAAGIDPNGFSGHSLRAGFATSAARAGISTFKIRAQTGHASDAMLSRYIRDGELFVGNAAGALL